jgi:predicted RNase H-like HicB family nuclease
LHALASKESGVRVDFLARDSEAAWDQEQRLMRGYPARFQPAKEGGFTVTFRDVPEAITEGDTMDEAMSAAADALESALSFYIADRKPLPKPSAPKRGERMVSVRHLQRS